MAGLCIFGAGEGDTISGTNFDDAIYGGGVDVSESGDVANAARVAVVREYNSSSPPLSCLDDYAILQQERTQ